MTTKDCIWSEEPQGSCKAWWWQCYGLELLCWWTCSHRINKESWRRMWDHLQKRWSCQRGQHQLVKPGEHLLFPTDKNDILVSLLLTSDVYDWLTRCPWKANKCKSALFYFDSVFVSIGRRGWVCCCSPEGLLCSKGRGCFPHQDSSVPHQWLQTLRSFLSLFTVKTLQAAVHP